MSELVEKVIQSELDCLHKVFPEVSNDMDDFTKEDMELQEIAAKAAIRTVLEEILKQNHVGNIHQDYIRQFASDNGITIGEQGE